MRYETSVKTMVEEEQAVWDSLVPRACELLRVLNEDADGLRLSRYINVLFGLRSAKKDHDFLINLQRQIYSQDEWYIADKFALQKTIKDYLGNIDSVLDYLEKLYHACKEQNAKKLFWFERKRYDFAQKIGDIRDEVVHEGVPALRFYPGQSIDTCHTDVAGNIETASTIEVKFELCGRGKWQQLAPMVTHTYCETRNFVIGVTEALCTGLGS